MRKENFYPVSIAFACNNDHGSDSGTFTAVEIGDDILRIENMWLKPRSPKFAIKINKIWQNGGFACSKVEGEIQIGREKFSIVGYKANWGNLIWDCVIVSIETARKIVDHLKTIECLRADEGYENWFDKFNAEGDFDWSDGEIADLKENGYQRP